MVSLQHRRRSGTIVGRRGALVWEWGPGAGPGRRRKGTDLAAANLASPDHKSEAVANPGARRRS
jgi:hypothetical protein